MRNLKRALSLALASVMLLGMMVVGAGAASYPDVDETHNVEAIDVLNAVEVMIGRQGNFEPTEAVNRHEMAVIMAKLVLGVKTADNYVGTHPFTDVVPWADKYVAACYENGLIAGTSATTYGGGQPLTAVQAAAMMLRALGYKDLSKGANDWRAPVTATANQIRLFNGVASVPSEQLNRNQVAQLALNTLKSSVVDLKDNTISFSDDSGKIVVTGGSREYIVRSSSESYARAINNTEVAGTSASSVSGYTVELGEHLYNGKLHLTNDVDAFGRPSRVWEYDGKDVGTYIRDELLRDEYTVSVKGSDVYDDLGTISIRDSDLEVYVDGVLGNKIVKDELVRTNRANLFGTGKGVLTQVFYDQSNKVVTITEINTYLAKATSDYNEKTDRANLEVYGFNKTLKERQVRQGTYPTNLNTVASYTNVKEDDVAEVVNLKEGDFILVTIADGALQSIKAPEILQDQKINTLKVADWVNTGSQKYDFAAAYDYDFEHVLTKYDIINMENASYNLYFDKYGYVVGADLYEGAKNYVFISGYDRSGSNIYDSTISAHAIFADGTQATIKVDAGKSDPSIGSNVDKAHTDQWAEKAAGNGVIVNKWYTYSVNSSNVYTLKLANQVWDNGTTHGGEITAARNGLQGIYGGTGNDVTVPAGFYHAGVPAANQVKSTIQWVYGDTDTNYIIVDPVDNIKEMGKAGGLRYGISGVTKTVTGVRNVDIDMYLQNADGNNDDTYGAYAVYDSNFHIVAAVVIGKDQGSDNYVYLTKGTPNQEAIRSDSEGNWYWEFDVITKEDGLTTKTLKGSYSALSSFIDGKGLYTFRYDGDGYVTGGTMKAVDRVDAAYDVAWDVLAPASGVVASEPKDIVYTSGSDTILPALAWATTEKLYANGRTLNDKATGDMYGVHLAPNAKIYTNLMINGGWETEEYTNLSSAVSALTYNTAGDNVTRRVYGILNSNGEAEVLVIEIARNFVTNQTGDYGNNGRLALTGLSLFTGDVYFTNTSSVAISSGAAANVQIRRNGTLVYNGTVALGSGVAAGTSSVVSFPYSSVSFGQEYNVTLTIVDGSNVFSGSANLWA
jgi:hypothetical protein